MFKDVIFKEHRASEEHDYLPTEHTTQSEWDHRASVEHDYLQMEHTTQSEWDHRNECHNTITEWMLTGIVIFLNSVPY